MGSVLFFVLKTAAASPVEVVLDIDGILVHGVEAESTFMATDFTAEAITDTHIIEHAKKLEPTNSVIEIITILQRAYYIYANGLSTFLKELHSLSQAGDIQVSYFSAGYAIRNFALLNTITFESASGETLHALELAKNSDGSYRVRSREDYLRSRMVKRLNGDLDRSILIDDRPSNAALGQEHNFFNPYELSDFYLEDRGVYFHENFAWEEVLGYYLDRPWAFPKSQHLSYALRAIQEALRVSKENKEKSFVTALNEFRKKERNALYLSRLEALKAAYSADPLWAFSSAPSATHPATHSTHPAASEDMSQPPQASDAAFIIDIDDSPSNSPRSSRDENNDEDERIGRPLHRVKKNYGSLSTLSRKP